jgi:DNA-binding LacI/PurR family transcriptional regulator
MNEESQKKVVLRHVAEHAGVSLGTASNVLAGRSGVAEKTRAAVLKAASELGYQSAPHALGVPYTSISTLAFLLRSSVQGPPSLNQFYSQVLYGVEQACSERGIGLLYATLDEKIESNEQLPLMIRRKQVQGLLTVGYFGEAFFDLLQHTKIPFVTLDYYFSTSDTDSVVSDDERGGYLATKYLIQYVPHPVLAMISGRHDHSSFHDRWRGYCRALAEQQIPYNEQYVCPSGSGTKEGYASMNTLLNLEVPPNAVFCCNDAMAIGALRALHERGIAVPEVCSIVGFDDTDAATQAVPPLTTIRVDKELLGREGVHLLLTRIEHPEISARHTVISVKLVERESVQMQ